MDSKKEKIIELLNSTNRDGIDILIEYLSQHGFFQSPASTRFHGCYTGGLAEHSYNVHDYLASYNAILRLDIPSETIIIASLLHDVCKIGAYLGNQKPYKWNRDNPKGHALLSIERIKKYIKLTELEEMMIKYHMGVYGLIEFDERKGEYGLRGGQMANAWHHNPIVKVMYFCDELATLTEKANEASAANERDGG